MRVHVEVLDALGDVRAAHLAEGFVTTIGGGDADDLYVEELVAGAITVEIAGDQATVRGGGEAHPIEEATVFSVLEGLSLRLTPYRRQVPQTSPGSCPRCGTALRDHAIGGAYRSMVSRERRCPRCETTVLETDDAHRTLGAFADLSRNDWVHVMVPMRCPLCTTSMRRVAFRTTHGEAEVERCGRCGLVALDPEDRRRLTAEP